MGEHQLTHSNLHVTNKYPHETPGIGEPVRIQTLIPQSAVEALHVGILHRLSRLNKLQAHAPFLTPGGQCPTAKLWPLIQNDRLRQSSLARDPVQHAAHSQPTQRGIHLLTPKGCRTGEALSESPMKHLHIRWNPELQNGFA
jgi:hypothetical protein